MRGLTFNHLPKNVLIRGVSLRFSEMPYQIMPVCRAAWIAGRDRLRAEGQVSDFSKGETPHGRPRDYAAILTWVPAGTSSKSSTTSWLRIRTHPMRTMLSVASG